MGRSRGALLAGNLPCPSFRVDESGEKCGWDFLALWSYTHNLLSQRQSYNLYLRIPRIPCVNVHFSGGKKSIVFIKYL